MNSATPQIRPFPSRALTIRFRWIVCFFSAPLLLLAGCLQEGVPAGEDVFVWGGRGIDPGKFVKPRAMAISPANELFIVDKLGRIQAFDLQGNYLRGWQTPLIEQGKPCGLTFSNDGLLMVADTHYFRILFYTPAGKLIEERTIGGSNGRGPGEFGFVTDVVQDSQGNYYVSDYGDYDRIQKFSPEGKFLFDWGGHGSEPGQFLRPQSLAIDESDCLWIADSCNHRIQIFDATGDSPKFVRELGTPGAAPGELRYPYSLILNPDETFFVCEFGNHRVQKFDRDGNFLAMFGTAGRQSGQFHQPWAVVVDQQGQMHMLDTYNHRVQSFRFEKLAQKPTTKKR